MASNLPPRGVVLVVDDEAGVRALARRILESGGYGVIEAENGADALAVMASSAPVDFLMADLDMPVMRGEEMAKKIRQLRPDLRVLYVTAHSEQLFKERPELLDGEAFLDKPFTVRGLLEAVSLLKSGYINEPPPAPPAGLARWWKTLIGKSR
jgi:two-component system, cell cycle sensor histidine kinase and response regulator CckA